MAQPPAHHRNAALQQALAALQAGRFGDARRLSTPWTSDPAGALLHALSRAAEGDVAGGGAALAHIAQANPAARHPVHDLLDLLRSASQADQAGPHIEAALHHTPGNPALLALLGAHRAEHGPMDAAANAFRTAAEAAPGDAAAWSNLGKALTALGQFNEAEAAFSRTAALAPHDPQLQLNHGIARLKAGRWADGFTLFRARHALRGRQPPPPGTELTSLHGIAGQRVLLLHDEGFGDTLQFIRYAPMLAARGAMVSAHVPPPLLRLLRAMPGIAVGTGPLPSYDAWIRIPDLPALFGTTPATIPATLPYLAADPILTAHWRTRLPPGRRVGLVWAGAPRVHDQAAAATDRVRSIPARLLAPLLAIPGITWINLQHGQPPPPGVFDPMRNVHDFAETAAIIATLHQVVTVDTAVAHLAAALGRPVLLLDRFDHCWRWLPGRDDSPWYPGRMRILRQTQPGDWDSVLRRAVDALHPADEAEALPTGTDR